MTAPNQKIVLRGGAGLLREERPGLLIESACQRREKNTPTQELPPGWEEHDSKGIPAIGLLQTGVAASRAARGNRLNDSPSIVAGIWPVMRDRERSRMNSPQQPHSFG